ncbi:TonB-dependent receptor plug domain-containing protein [Alteriqipengyuania lutimaris]|uniref:TonB-dependent receptor n=1 Tax=Alteriqipengyuania lutimaris TaxID=1538146 RepID=A0A395LNB6_9SPHN|nr:TonB-dependent receptor [Alteriqipengyuania lutimaris]MBB3035277.1 vitamin B12 transporter [Alteriqipengyuania lutimaris]RDS76130.1 TonB-dependent receptor [Alteriqipengyuania lutimaris]
MRKFLFLGCSILGLATPALAQDDVQQDDVQQGGGDPVLASEAYTLDDEATTITVTGSPSEVEDTGQPVTVIGAEEIADIQGPDFTRVLQRVPGVTINRTGGLGATTGVSVRGASNDQLLVLIDGVRVADTAAPAGGFDFGTLTSSNLAKVELLRGSNSVIWGADALAGVLVASTFERTGLAGSVEAGSRETVSTSVEGGIAGDIGFLGGSASYLTTDGFSAAASGTEPDGFRQQAYNLRGRAYLSRTFEIFASGRYADGTLEIDGFPAPSFTLGDTPEVQETRQLSGVVGALYDGGPLYLRGAYSVSDIERANLPGSGLDPTFESDGGSERVELRGEWRPIGPLIVNFGAENLWSDYESTSYGAVSDAQTSIFGAYAQLGIEFRGISGHLGLRQDEHEDFGGATSFGGDFTYEIVPDLRLRASVGEGFKAPSLYQLFSDYGNAALQPEESTSYDLGLAYGTRISPFYASVTAFQRDSENLIAFIGCPDQTGICENRPFGTYDNVTQARARGIEVEAGASPVEGLRLRAAYAYTEAENRSDGTANFGNRLARRPEHAGTLSLDWAPLPETIGAPVIGGDLRIVGEAFDDAGNNVLLDGYTVFDLRVSVPLGLIAGERPVEVFGRVENLFDEEYQTAAGYNQAPRGAFAGIRVGL